MTKHFHSSYSEKTETMVVLGNKAVNGTRSSSPTSLNHSKTLSLSSNSIINLDQGDPTVFEPYWKNLGDKCMMVISASDSMSYFSDAENLCWFLEPKLADAIRNVHLEIGNAISIGRHIVVGTGSTQLYQAALYALSSPDGPQPINVVSAAPYYSQYPEETNYLRSGLYKWAGDAYTFGKDDEPYIEVITSPGNPDGSIREAVLLNRGGGKQIYDLAYYWPQYTPITCPADHDIMLFTFSKCTGHAGSRIGWALVKDTEVARKMIKFIELSSIGVSKESQLRAALILGTLCDGYQNFNSNKSDNFFEYSQCILAERWKKLREVVKGNELFSLPDYPLEYCNFTGRVTQSHPAFAWLQCKEDVDCEKLIKAHKMIVRGGVRFGAAPNYARISMLSSESVFNLLLQRLSAIKGIN